MAEGCRGPPLSGFSWVLKNAVIYLKISETRRGLFPIFIPPLFFVLKMMSAFYVCCIHASVLQTRVFM